MLTGSSLTIAAAATALFLSACGPQGKEDSTAETTTTNAVNRIQLLDAAPSNPITVKAAREQMEPGDKAIVFGQIGGVAQPFLDGYAGFVLADTEIAFCDEMGDDHCPTPWDACCEDADKLKASRASIQFVDAEGNILPGSVKHFAGLEELSHVAVTGTVAASSTPENLIIKATELYVNPTDEE